MLALISGAGTLPTEIAARLERPPVVCALDGFPPDTLKATHVFRLETLGTLLASLRSEGVSEVCMAGAIGRPGIDPDAIDSATRPMVPTLQRALSAGDGEALHAVIAIFEQAGLAVRGAHEIAPDLLPAPGCATEAQPSESDRADAARGAAIAAAMSQVDIGQACVVLNRQAIAIEAAYGTDWMLHSLGGRPDGGGGLLFKAPKLAQDRRVDLPTIGPGTVAAAQSAGLRGIVIEAGGVMVLDRPGVLECCADAGLFLWVREPDA